MTTGTIFGVSVALGMLLALLVDQKYIIEGMFFGIAVGALIVRKKNKKNEKE